MERWSTGHKGERVKVTEAEVVLVAIDASGRPMGRNERVTRPESWPSARPQGTRHPNLLFPFPALPFIL